MLDRDHDEALGKLESLPAADDINDSFILLVSALCSGALRSPQSVQKAHQRSEYSI